MEKIFLGAGIFCAPWWVASLLVFGSLEPNYSHLYKAVSELGAFGAANALAMNIFCFFLTGVLVILAGIGFKSVLNAKGVSASSAWWLIILGVMLAGAAVPADFNLYFKSPWTLVHAFFVMLGVIPFLVASCKTHYILKKLNLSSIFISYFPLLIIPAFCLHGFLNQGGLVQRLTILIVLLWVSYLSWFLLGVKRHIKHGDAKIAECGVN
ncbi:MAG TPA: DUF998 domain-containing protein [Cellvibrio sp.]|nr:DUF998 domain-containing protein [Cellvibrio sp.]